MLFAAGHQTAQALSLRRRQLSDGQWREFRRLGQGADTVLKKVILGVLSALPLLPMAGNSLAQSSYHEQTVAHPRRVFAGRGPDVTALLLADKLTEAWGKPVVVENVTGAGGNIAASASPRPRPTALPSA